MSQYSCKEDKLPFLPIKLFSTIPKKYTSKICSVAKPIKNTDVLQFLRFRKLISRNNEQRGQIYASILIGLHLKALLVPMDGIDKTLLVSVLRFNKNVLVNSAAETQHVRVVVLFFLQGLSDHRQGCLAVTLVVAPV